MTAFRRRNADIGTKPNTSSSRVVLHFVPNDIAKFEDIVLIQVIVPQSLTAPTVIDSS